MIFGYLLMPENTQYDMSVAHTRAVHSMCESYSKLLSA